MRNERLNLHRWNVTAGIVVECDDDDDDDAATFEAHPLTDEDTVFPRIIDGGDYFYFRTKRGRLFEGRRLFQIFLAGGPALYILFYYTKQ